MDRSYVDFARLSQMHQAGAFFVTLAKKKFLGNSEKAVKRQIWCAVSTYMLIAIVKKELQLNASLYNLL